MKKILVKTLMVLGIAWMWIFAWSLVNPVNAQRNSQKESGGTFGLAGNGVGETNIVAMVKNVVNWILGLVALIALIMALYGGFTMITSAGDDGKYKQGFKILKNAAIGLIIIGLSWIIISGIFRLVSTIGSGQKATPTAV